MSLIRPAARDEQARPVMKGSAPLPVMDIRLGDVYRLRKPHPCGSYDWRVRRVGADIGIVCLGCERRVLLPRSTFERRAKTLLSREDPPPGASPGNEET